MWTKDGFNQTEDRADIHQYHSPDRCNHSIKCRASQANVDVGFLINRAHGLVSNAAIYYSETLDTFVTAFTSNSGGTDSNILISSYADFTTGNVYTTGLYWTGNGDPITFSGGSGTYGDSNVATYLAGNITVGNIAATGYYFANGVPFTSSNYGNVDVAAYLTDYFLYANSNAASQSTAFNTLDANVGSYQIWANTSISGLQANAAFQANLIDVLTGNAASQGSLLDVLVANAAAQSANLTSLLSNAASQEESLTSLVANAAGQSSAIDSINANVAAANAAIITANTDMKSYVDAQVVSAGGYGNVQVAAYLPEYTGNLNPGNITATGNIVGGGVRTTTSATAPTNPSPGDMWYDTTVDVLFRYTDVGTSRYWLDINGQTLSFDLSGNVVSGNVIATGYYFANGAPFVSSTYSDANVAAYLDTYFTYANANAATQSSSIATLQTQVYTDSNVASYLTGNITVGNIVPTGNNVVNLGSPTARFGSLYLAGNTIDLGGTLITTTANGSITISGDLNISGNVSATVPLYSNANVAVYLPTHTGNVSANTITVDNGIFWSNGNSYSSGSGGITQARAWATTMLFGG